MGERLHRLLWAAVCGAVLLLLAYESTVDRVLASPQGTGLDRAAIGAAVRAAFGFGSEDERGDRCEGADSR